MVQTVFGCGRASECATGISVFLLGDFCHTHELQLHAHPRSLSNVCSIPDSCVRPPLVRRTKYYPTILRESYVFRGPDLFQDEALFICLFIYLFIAPHWFPSVFPTSNNRMGQSHCDLMKRRGPGGRAQTVGWNQSHIYIPQRKPQYCWPGQKWNYEFRWHRRFRTNRKLEPEGNSWWNLSQ